MTVHQYENRSAPFPTLPCTYFWWIAAWRQWRYIKFFWVNLPLVDLFWWKSKNNPDVSLTQLLWKGPNVFMTNYGQRSICFDNSRFDNICLQQEDVMFPIWHIFCIVSCFLLFSVFQVLFPSQIFSWVITHFCFIAFCHENSRSFMLCVGKMLGSWMFYPSPVMSGTRMNLPICQNWD